MTFRHLVAQEPGGRTVGSWHPATTPQGTVLVLGAAPDLWLTPEPSRLPRALTAAGWWPFTADTTSVGNQTDLDTIDALIAWAAARGANTAQVALVARGDATLAAVNWGLRNRDRTAALALVCPDLSGLSAGSVWDPTLEHRRHMVAHMLGDRLTMWWAASDPNAATLATLAGQWNATVKVAPSTDPASVDPVELVAATTAAWGQRTAKARDKAWRAWAEASPNNQGYKGGDAITPTLLASGAEFYTSADNAVGTIDADGTYGGVLPRRNAIILVTNGVFSQQYGSGGGTPFVPTAPDTWYWPLGHCLENDVLRLVCLYVALGGVIGDYQDTHILTVNPSTFAVSSITALGLPDILTAIPYAPLVDSTWIYIRAEQHLAEWDEPLADQVTYTKLARVAYGSMTTPSAWRWWDGSEWQADQLAAAPLVDTAGTPLSGDTALRRHRAGYVLAVMPLTGNVRLYRSGFPQGPWEQYGQVSVPTGLEHYGSTSVGYQTAWVPHLDPSSSELMLVWSGNFAGADPPTTPGTDQDPDWACPHHLIVPAPTFT